MARKTGYEGVDELHSYRAFFFLRPHVPPLFRVTRALLRPLRPDEGGVLTGGNVSSRLDGDNRRSTLMAGRRKGTAAGLVK